MAVVRKKAVEDLEPHECILPSMQQHSPYKDRQISTTSKPYFLTACNGTNYAEIIVNLKEMYWNILQCKWATSLEKTTTLCRAYPLQQIGQRSIERIGLKIAKICCLYLDIFSCVKVDVFCSFFVLFSGSSCMSDAMTSTTVEKTGELFWDSRCCLSDEYQRLELGVWKWYEGLPGLSADCKILID